MIQAETKADPAPIPHRFWAVADEHRRGFVGMYSAPGAGSCHVRDKDGLIRFFASEERALLAASRAMCAALDAGRADRSSLHRVFRTMGQGRNRRAVEVA
ncbi:hypothetical protein [Bosea minatitlanensis]|uniref:DUF1488 family protein n=1 Tax=Bosea minatitlanensis TaxID=128782 RepID=A0ABW0F2F2_9HYPH|nr:hypothetical protein [Bosea minatitlanensis]MCT4492743.1 hypothetical protein [Bosea minatitlanensis]